jgi:hypothetical protein
MQRVGFIIVGITIIGGFLNSCATVKNKTDNQLYLTGDQPYFYEVFEIYNTGYESVSLPIDETFNNIKAYRNALYAFATGDNYFSSGAITQKNLYLSLTQTLLSDYVNILISYVDSKGNICIPFAHPSDSNKRHVLYIEKLDDPLIQGNLWYDLPQLFLLKMGMTEKEIKNIHNNIQISEIYPNGKIRFNIETNPASVFYAIIDPKNGLEAFIFINKNFTEERVLRELTSIFGLPEKINGTYNFHNNLPENIKRILFNAFRDEVRIMYIYENAD